MRARWVLANMEMFILNNFTGWAVFNTGLLVRRDKIKGSLSCLNRLSQNLFCLKRRTNNVYRKRILLCFDFDPPGHENTYPTYATYHNIPRVVDDIVQYGIIRET